MTTVGITGPFRPQVWYTDYPMAAAHNEVNLLAAAGRPWQLWRMPSGSYILLREDTGNVLVIRKARS